MPMAGWCMKNGSLETRPLLQRKKREVILKTFIRRRHTETGLEHGHDLSHYQLPDKFRMMYQAFKITSLLLD